MIFRLDLKKHLYDRHTGSPRDQGIGVRIPKETQEKEPLVTLQVSKVSQKDSFQQRWSQIFGLNQSLLVQPCV